MRRLTKPLAMREVLQHQAVVKMSSDETNNKAHQYFSLFFEEDQKQNKTQIGDILSMLATFAEVYSEDSFDTLFRWGIVIFNDILALDISRMSCVLSLNPDAVLQLIRFSKYLQLPLIPKSCVQSLIRLGFIDSDFWSFYLIPQNDSFAFHLLRFPALIQPYPAELIDELKIARDKLNSRYRS